MNDRKRAIHLRLALSQTRCSFPWPESRAPTIPAGILTRKKRLFWQQNGNDQPLTIVVQRIWSPWML